MMKCLSTTTVAQLAERLHEQALEVALLRLVVDLQSRRLFHSQRDERLALPVRRRPIPGRVTVPASQSVGFDSI
jgi:hypothetical protein